MRLDSTGHAKISLTKTMVRDGYQQFEIETIKQRATFYVTPQGYIRMILPRRNASPSEAVRGDDG